MFEIDQQIVPAGATNRGLYRTVAHHYPDGGIGTLDVGAWGYIPAESLSDWEVR